MIEKAEVVRAVTFHRTKDVTGLPSPVKIVELGIEGVVGRIEIGVGVIALFVQSHHEANSLIVATGNLAQGELGSVVSVGNEGDELAIGFHPRTVFALKGKLGEKVVAAGDLNAVLFFSELVRTLRESELK